MNPLMMSRPMIVRPKIPGFGNIFAISVLWFGMVSRPDFKRSLIQ